MDAQASRMQTRIASHILCSILIRLVVAVLTMSMRTKTELRPCSPSPFRSWKEFVRPLSDKINSVDAVGKSSHLPSTPHLWDMD
ncbi:hypothetical protein FN846DRAFT_554076 [Sphaerosporella brunnea]|uniref:Uncharacterized protein n=1 Tax=Sphaerosporella brunnea TaxID=1250544 RepID=A0A5J5F256_9PEZI|nr:hypothetical protein FN846DRAFT_554076 [Sphaerosporella brunnea]